MAAARVILLVKDNPDDERLTVRTLSRAIAWGPTAMCASQSILSSSPMLSVSWDSTGFWSMKPCQEGRSQWPIF